MGHRREDRSNRRARDRARDSAEDGGKISKKDMDVAEENQDGLLHVSSALEFECPLSNKGECSRRFAREGIILVVWLLARVNS